MTERGPANAGAPDAGTSGTTGTTGTGTGTGPGTGTVYQDLRPLLFSIAYRMLGTVTEAEDLVQEAFLRYHKAVAAHGQPESPKAYLSAVITRLCIDYLRSARVRRESYVGEWMPEPLVTGASALSQQPADPAELAEQADSLSMAFLLLLERLTPVERAAFLLHDVFAYDYGEIAEIVGRSEATCRQLVHRARQHVDAGKPRFDVAAAERDELAARFFDAVTGGDMAELVSLLAADVEVHGDNGGVPPAWPRPIIGRDHVSRLLGAIGKELGKVGGSFRLAEVNRQPGALALDQDGRLIAVFALDIADGQVQLIRSVISRSKLQHLAPLADLAALVNRTRNRPQPA